MKITHKTLHYCERNKHLTGGNSFNSQYIVCLFSHWHTVHNNPIISVVNLSKLD